MKKHMGILLFRLQGISLFKKPLRTLMILIIVLITGLLKPSSVFCQDLILLKTGDEIKSKVIEIGPALIKYKKFENLTGPDYSIEKINVFMIKYENGSKDVFSQETASKPQTIQETTAKETDKVVQSTSPKFLERRGASVRLDGKYLTTSQLRAIMEPYPDVLSKYNSGKTLSFVGDAFAYTVIGVCLITAIRAKDYKYGTVEYRSIYTTGLIIALPLAAVGITLSAIGGGKIRSSLNLYNSHIQKPVTYNLNFGIQESGGVGFSLRF
jgi:hypothetical protein